MNVSELGHGAHPNDPTMAAKPDGCTVVEHKESFLVYGGWAADRVWRLDIPAATWTEIVTHGTIPHARIHHASTVYNGFMITTGGELVEARPGTRTAHLLSYYELDLDNYEWTAVETFGSVPGNRSHHTANVVNDVLVVFGGKPADGRLLTNGTMAEAKRTGFFDVYILHVLSRTWRRVEMYDPRSPMLWGHSGSVFRDSFIVCFGGFDVGAEELAGAAPFAHNNELIETPPEAILSDTVHILDMGSMTWKRCTAGSDLPHAAKAYGTGAPIARSDHVASIIGLELHIFGGFAVDRTGRGVNVNDFWKWDIETGQWTKVEFCIPTFNSRRLIAGGYGDHFVVVPRMQHLFFLNTARRGSGWQKVPCTVESRPLEDSRRVPGTTATTIDHDEYDRDESPTRRAMRQRGPQPAPEESTHSQHASLVPRGFRNLRTPSPESARREAQRGAQPSTPAREYDAEVQRLHRELETLRARVGEGQQSHGAPLVAKPRDPTPGPSAAPPPPQGKSGLHRWLAGGGQASHASPTRKQRRPGQSPRAADRGLPSARADRQPSPVQREEVSPETERAHSYERMDLPARREWVSTHPRSEDEQDMPQPWRSGSGVQPAASSDGYPAPPAHRGAASPLPALGPHRDDSPLKYAPSAGRDVSASPIRLHASLAGTKTLQRQREALKRTRREQLAKLRTRLEALRRDPSNSAVDQALIDSLEAEARKVELAMARADSPSRSSSPIVDGDYAAHPLGASRASTRAPGSVAPSPAGATLMQRARMDPGRAPTAPRDATPPRRQPSDSAASHPAADAHRAAVRHEPQHTGDSFTRRHASPHGVASAFRGDPHFAPTVSIGMPRPPDRDGFVIARAPSTALAQEVAAHRQAVADVGDDADSRPLTPVGDYWDELDRALDAPRGALNASGTGGGRSRPRPEWQL